MTQNQNNNRILGDLYTAPIYSLGAPSWVPSRVGVYEDTTNNRIFFPAAGYTQEVTYYPSEVKLLDSLLRGNRGTNRQNIIHDMLQNSPVGGLVNGRAELVQEPNNSYDKNAIQIIGVQAIGKEQKSRAYYPIGYVPARCGTNKKLLANWDKILLDTGQITILKDSKGYLVPMVSFVYYFPVLAKDSRFTRLQYE